MKRLFLVPLCIAILASCTNVLDKKINLNTVKNDIEKIKQQNPDEYTDVDYNEIGNEFSGDFFAKMMNAEQLNSPNEAKPDKTYRQVLDEAKSKRFEYERRLTEYNKSLEPLKAALKAGINNKFNQDVNGISLLSVVYGFENQSQQDIMEVQGSMFFVDGSNNELGKLNVEVSGGNLSAGKGAYVQKDYVIDNFDMDVKNIALADINTIKTKWLPSRIVFSDGSSLNAVAPPTK